MSRDWQSILTCLSMCDECRVAKWFSALHAKQKYKNSRESAQNPRGHSEVLASGAEQKHRQKSTRQNRPEAPAASTAPKAPSTRAARHERAPAAKAWVQCEYPRCTSLLGVLTASDHADGDPLLESTNTGTGKNRFQ
jgi:hypothetical protein